MTTTTAAKSTASALTKSPERIHNFSAGPAVLPEEVIHQAQEDIWNIDGSGIGIMEHSHRGKVFDRVIDEAVADCRTLGKISDNYAVLFLQGGATLQFAMIPMNFLPEGKSADYADTGVWATKAIKEAKKFGKVNLAYDGSKSHYDHIPTPKELTLDVNAAYFHYCSNNTIYGTRWHETPDVRTPLIVDASSEIYSRPIDIEKHALIYAGAQKNLGPSGVTLVIIRRDFMKTGRDGLPLMLDYRKQAEQDSRLNTPPAFGIYVMGQVFKWILRQGGLTAIEQRNNDKAAIIYDAIDQSGGFYTPVARNDSRSIMNVTFRCPSEDLDARFVKEAESNDMSGLKGHRDAGGLRASIYNAFPREGCSALAQFMKDYAAKNG